MAIWKVGADGKAPSEAKPGDHVVTAGGTYKIGNDGKGIKIEGSPTTATYTGKYANVSTTPTVAASGNSGVVATGGASTPATPAVSQPTGSASASLPVYSMGTQAGSDVYNRVKQSGTGEYITNADGSKTYISLGADGQVYAFQNGNKLLVQNNWTPSQQSGGAADSEVDGNDTASLVAALLALFGNENNSYSKQYLNQQKAANDAAVQQAINSLNQQKTASEQSYANLFRQLYINKMRARKNLDQEMAAQGLTGGATETTKLGLETGYADALRQGGIERINTLSGLDQAIANARLSGDISYAQTAAQAAQNNLQSYAGVLQNLLSRADQQESLNRSTAYQVSMQILGNGNMPDDATLAAAGIRKSDAQMLMDAAVKANGTQYSSSQAQTALMAAANGNRSDAVRKIVESVYGLPLETVLLAYGYR